MTFWWCRSWRAALRWQHKGWSQARVDARPDRRRGQAWQCHVPVLPLFGPAEAPCGGIPREPESRLSWPRLPAGRRRGEDGRSAPDHLRPAGGQPCSDEVVLPDFHVRRAFPRSPAPRSPWFRADRDSVLVRDEHAPSNDPGGRVRPHAVPWTPRFASPKLPLDSGRSTRAGFPARLSDLPAVRCVARVRHRLRVRAARTSPASEQIKRGIALGTDLVEVDEKPASRAGQAYSP